jgi:hypothetical protein
VAQEFRYLCEEVRLGSARDSLMNLTRRGREPPDLIIGILTSQEVGNLAEVVDNIGTPFASAKLQRDVRATAQAHPAAFSPRCRSWSARACCVQPGYFAPMIEESAVAQDALRAREHPRGTS